MARPSCGRRSSTATADRAASAPPTRRCGSTRSSGKRTMRTSRTATRRNGSSSAGRLAPAQRALTSTRRSSPTQSVGGTIFEGSQSVWRTQDWGGDQAYLEANCPEFTVSATNPACGDFVRIGPSGNTDLTAAGLRHTCRRSGLRHRSNDERQRHRVGGHRCRPRLHLEKRATRAAGSVTFTRLDTLASAIADRTGPFLEIYVDPANPNHAWISYSGYNFNTPTLPGHVFSVTYNGTNRRDLDEPGHSGRHGVPDFPANDVVYDSVAGDLYVANDFGVMRLANGATSWTLAGPACRWSRPAACRSQRRRGSWSAATHGRSAWTLTLP